MSFQDILCKYKYKSTYTVSTEAFSTEYTEPGYFLTFLSILERNFFPAFIKFFCFVFAHGLAPQPDWPQTQYSLTSAFQGAWITGVAALN
jgi:hypothetical protein